LWLCVFRGYGTREVVLDIFGDVWFWTIARLRSILPVLLHVTLVRYSNEFYLSSNFKKQIFNKFILWFKKCLPQQPTIFFITIQVYVQHQKLIHNNSLKKNLNRKVKNEVWYSILYYIKAFHIHTSDTRLTFFLLLNK